LKGGIKMVKVFTSKTSANNFARRQRNIEGWKYVAEEVNPSNVRGFKGKKAFIITMKKRR
jgi:hypothetical protein